ncbi:MAG TPA: hypothetical protein VNQ76_10615 [Planctomicrobium sp.]|nr:hypothetical protein [Planctomicrobium sp.]
MRDSIHRSPPAVYTPGVCNLGSAETRLRYAVGIAGILIAVLLGWGLIVAEVPRLLRLIVFLPAFVGTLGFLQAFSRFCVAYGIRGVFNVSMSLGKQDTVEQAEFRKKDRKTAITIISLAVIVSMAATAVIYAFP